MAIEHHLVLVYNWSTDDVVKWVVDYVHLPMYVENFRRNQIDGRMIPRYSLDHSSSVTCLLADLLDSFHLE